MNKSLFETLAQTPALRQAVASITPQDPVTDDGGSLLGVAAIVSVSNREPLRKKPANISGYFQHGMNRSDHNQNCRIKIVAWEIGNHQGQAPLPARNLSIPPFSNSYKSSESMQPVSGSSKELNQAAAWASEYRSTRFANSPKPIVEGGEFRANSAGGITTGFPPNQLVMTPPEGEGEMDTGSPSSTKNRVPGEKAEAFIHHPYTPGASESKRNPPQLRPSPPWGA